jgi:hypothetical protein
MKWKVLRREDINAGQMLPESWIAYGKHYMMGGYFKICIPFFRRFWGKRPEMRQLKYGWYVPSIRVLWRNHEVIITWWYEFFDNYKGEERIQYDRDNELISKLR